MSAMFSWRRFTCVLCPVILVMIAAAVYATVPTFADPPVGSWTGKLDDGTVVTLTAMADGVFHLEGRSTAAVVGTWTWSSASPVTGILWVEPLDASKQAPTAFNVTWLAPDRIEFSDGHWVIVLRHML